VTCSCGRQILLQVEQELAAALRACTRDIRAGQVSDLHLQQWWRTFLTTSVRLQAASDANTWTRSFCLLTANLELSNQAETATLTKLQKVNEIGKHRQAVGSAESVSVSHKDVWNDLNQNIKIHSVNPDTASDVGISESMVDCALTIHDCLRSDAAIILSSLLRDQDLSIWEATPASSTHFSSCTR